MAREFKRWNAVREAAGIPQQQRFLARVLIDDADRCPLSPSQAAQQRTFPNCRFVPEADIMGH